MIGAPMALILMQPDLGTSLLLAATGAAIIFMAG
jgi:rod shape determining protein RodA